MSTENPDSVTRAGITAGEPDIIGSPGTDGARKPQVTWIGGWGIDPLDWRPLTCRFPGAEHRFLAPVAGVAETAARSDYVIAWSLGAWRVLEAAARGVGFRGRVRLLAPFIAFCSEYGMGGRSSVTQVRWLRRWIQRDPMRGLNDFRQRSGLKGATERLPYPLADLLEGLDRLAEDAPPALRSFASRGLPRNWEAAIGESDPLLAAGVVGVALPGCRVVPGAGHAAEELLAALETRLDAI